MSFSALSSDFFSYLNTALSFRYSAPYLNFWQSLQATIFIIFVIAAFKPNGMSFNFFRAIDCRKRKTASFL